MEIISNRDRFWSSLKRLYKNNDGIMFKNKDDTFKIMIRPDPDGSAGHFVVFDLVIVFEESNTTLNKILELTTDGWFSEDNDMEYVVESWEFDKRNPDVSELKEMMEYTNKTYNFVFCQCGKHFIKDGGDMCVFCEMTGSDEDFEKFECPICMEEGYNMHSKLSKCCSNKMHKMCYDRWYKEGNKKCAICRADLPQEMQDSDHVNIENIVSSIAEAVERRLNRNSIIYEETCDETDEETEETIVD